MSSRCSPGMPGHMCDDILRGSPYGLDFSVMAKARVIVAAPGWSTSTIPAGCVTAISARLTIPGRVGPVARHIGLQDHRVVDVTTEMQRCMEEPREARDARDVTGEQHAACARYAGTRRRQPAWFPEPSGWRRRRCEQDRFTAPAGRRPRAPGRVNSLPQDLTGVAGIAMPNLSPLCTGRVHVQPSSRSRQVDGRRLRPRMVSAGR